jgi:signal transduction histidine kinase/CheY-like chemotaxis protein
VTEQIVNGKTLNGEILNGQTVNDQAVNDQAATEKTPGPARRSAQPDSVLGWLAASLAVALACALAGKLSYALAFPSGFASPLFLPAGISGAAVLILGSRMLPGIYCGYLLYLYWSDAGALFGEHASIAILLLAAGATLQAQVLVYLLRRYGGWPNARSSGFSALRQVLLAGPIASVVSPTIGVITLLVTGAIGAGDVVFNWLTWWVGDSLGAALAGPVVAVLLSWRLARRQRALASFVLPMSLTIAFVGLAIHEIGQRDIRQMHAAFEREVLFASNALFGRFETVLMALEALNGLFTASESVTRDEFNRFVDPWISSIPMIQAIGWSQRVPSGQLAAHEAAMRNSGAAGYVSFDRQAQSTTSTPAPAEEYLVVSYVSPVALNANIQGLNQLSFSETRDAILEARRSGSTRSSAPFQLLQRGPGGMGVVVFRALPAREGEAALPAPDGSMPHQGAVFISLYLHDSFDGLPVDSTGSIRMCLFDVTDPGRPMHLAGQSDCAATSLAYGAKELARSIDRSIGGRQWRLLIEAGPEHLRASRNWGSWLLSVLGLLGASMLGVFLLAQIDRQRQFQREVSARSRELASEIREREAAQSANRAKSEFLSRMSHELRTPLNAVLGFAQLLAADRNPPLSATQHEQIALIEKAGWHLRDMIDEVLDLARIEAGALRLQLEAVDLVGLLEDCRSMLGAEASRRGIELRAPTLPGEGGDRRLAVGASPAPFLQADPTRLRQILLNFLGNAIKYTEGGHVSLEIDYPTAGEIAVSVIDSGPGLSAAQLARLFVPFDRLGREKTSAGTGIGLVISRQLAEAMGGRLTVESRPGLGSRFTVTLPRAASRGNPRIPSPSAGQAASSDNAGERAARPQAGAEPPWIVCIEDNPLNVALFRDAIATAGDFRLDHHALASDGLHAVRTLQPALVILDLNLPDRHGTEVLAALRADPRTRTIPVMVVSADATPGTREHTLAAGATAFVPKPLDLRAFAEQVRAIAHSPSPD